MKIALTAALPIVVVMGLVGGTTPLAAQDCGYCDTSFCIGGEHRVTPDFGSGFERFGAHYVCMMGEEPTCEETHPDLCDPLKDADLELLASLESLVEGGDVDGLARFAASVLGQVSFNDTRNALQVLDCGGTDVVLHVPLGTIPYEEVALRAVLAKLTEARPLLL